MVQLYCLASPTAAASADSDPTVLSTPLGPPSAGHSNRHRMSNMPPLFVAGDAWFDCVLVGASAKESIWTLFRRIGASLHHCAGTSCCAITGAGAAGLLLRWLSLTCCICSSQCQHLGAVATYHGGLLVQQVQAGAGAVPAGRDTSIRPGETAVNPTRCHGRPCMSRLQHLTKQCLDCSVLPPTGLT
jgi:hypothetical protein